MRARMFWSLLVCLLLCGGIALAQVTTGTISGTINDSTGAVIPGAAVTVRNVETGISRAVTSDAAGRYRVTQLAVGTYEITAEAPGFQTTVRSGVTLTIGREAAVDFSLQVGAVAERITVTGEAPLVESTKAEISGLVDERQMQTLPLNGRSFANLTAIQAGVVTDFHQNSDIQRGGTPFVSQGPKMSINGARPNQAMYLLDGTEITSLRYNNIPGSMAGQLLGVEAVREFTVLKSNYGAQYGRGVGGILNAVTRSGTNEFHGSAFEFFRNSALDAKDFFNDPTRPIPPLRRNQFGGSIAGPIIKDKAFFMGSYEAIRQFIGLAALSTVPTPQTRAGLGPVFGNPATPATKHKDIDPFLALIPLPDPALNLGNGYGELKGFRPRPISEDNGVVRYDQQLSEKDFFFSRLTLDRSFMNNFNSGFIPGFSQPATGRYYYLTIGETRILTSSLLNEFRAGFARNVNKVDEIIPTLDPRLGVFPGAKLMDFSIQGMTVDNKIASGFQEPFAFYENTFDFTNNLIYTAGRHSITMGANLKRYRPNIYQSVWEEGITTFSNFANFYRSGQIEGVVSLGFPGTFDHDRGWRQTYWALYVQDDFRIRPNLTLNLGLRMERITEPREVNDKVSTIRNAISDPGTTLGYPWIKIEDRMKNFSPRVGLAWTPFGDQKTVIRSGFGTFKEPIMPAHYALYIYTKPLATVIFLNRATQGTIPFPYPLGTDPKAPLPPASSVFMEWNAVTPFTMQWNFALERQLTETMVTTATYIGTRGLHLNTSANPNQFIPVMKSDPTVGYDRWYTPGSGEAGFGLRANPKFEAYRMSPWGGSSFYNGLELELKQRYSRGLQYNVSYTWAKNLSDVGIGNEGQQGSQGSPQNWYDRDAEWSRSALHVSRNFIVSSTYDLPFGSGRAYGANWTGVTNAILGGWSINGIARKRSGLTFSASIGSNRSRSGGVQGSGSVSERPDLKAGGNNNPIEGVSSGCGPFAAGRPVGGIDLYFDPCQFVLPPAGRYGNLGGGVMTGPGLFNMDFSVFKNFPIREGTDLQFRAEFFNIPNHPNFGNPGSQVITGGLAVNTNAGRITGTATDSRRVQFALKLTF